MANLSLSIKGVSSIFGSVNSTSTRTDPITCSCYKQAPQCHYLSSCTYSSVAVPMKRMIWALTPCTLVEVYFY